MSERTRGEIASFDCYCTNCDRGRVHVRIGCPYRIYPLYFLVPFFSLLVVHRHPIGKWEERNVIEIVPKGTISHRPFIVSEFRSFKMAKYHQHVVYYGKHIVDVPSAKRWKVKYRFRKTHSWERQWQNLVMLSTKHQFQPHPKCPDPKISKHDFVVAQSGGSDEQTLDNFY